MDRNSSGVSTLASPLLDIECEEVEVGADVRIAAVLLANVLICPELPLMTFRHRSESARILSRSLLLISALDPYSGPGLERVEDSHFMREREMK